MYTDNSFVRFDWAAKSILRDKSDFEVFEGLMTVLIGEPVKIIELLESESNKQTKKSKSNQVDIKAKNSRDEIILVEIQLEPGSWYMQRILFGVSKAITEHIITGQDYSNVKKVYSINILYYNFGDGEDYLYHGTNQFVGVHTGDTLQMGEGRKNDTTAPGLQKAREKLRVLSMTDRERWAYEQFLSDKWYERDVIDYAETQAWNKGFDNGYDKGIDIGIDMGIDKGKTEEREKMIQKMKALGVGDHLIAEITGSAG